MGSRGIRDDAAPWSFFLPVTLAVLVGAVLAGVVLRMVDRVFEPAPAHVAAAETTGRAMPAAAEAASAEPMPATRAADVRTADPVAAEPRAPVPAAAPRDDADVPVLPGAIVARRDGAPEACINGSIARRAENGWEQRLENDAPVPCVEQSAAAR